jgi:GYF domain 2
MVGVNSAMDTSPTSSGWWYASNGNRKGPIGEQELQRLLVSGTLGPNSLVWKQGMRSWQQIRQMEALVPLLASLPPNLPAAKIGRETYAEARKLLQEIQNELQDPNLSGEQREELKLHAARLAGVLCHPWFPMSWGRRLIMAAIFLFGLVQAAIGNYQPMLWWLLLPVFSPRIVGEAAHLMGRVRGLMSS